MRKLLAFVLVLTLGLGGLPRAGQAEEGAAGHDVPPKATKWYEQAAALAEKGDEKSIKKAFSVLSRAKKTAADSVDYWYLYLRLWKATGKKEEMFWERVLPRYQKEHPRSPNWQYLRARLAKTDEERRACYEKAAELVPPGDLRPRLLILEMMLAAEEEDEAEEQIEALLEKHPDHEELLEMKGRIILESGLTHSALDFAEERLAAKKSASMYHLKALCCLNLYVDGGDAERLKPGVEASKKAIEMRADPRFVLTAARFLELSDKSDEALALLSKHHASSGDPALATRIGSLAFRTADYAQAVASLEAAAASSETAAKAWFAAQARMGDREALERGLELIGEGASPALRRQAGHALLLAGAGEKALSVLEGLDIEGAAWVRAQALAWEGRPDALLAAHKAAMLEGKRAGEDAFGLWLEARLIRAMGGQASQWKQQLLKARARAGQGKIARAKAADQPVLLSISNGDFAKRVVTYFRSANGVSFEPAGGLGMSMTMTDDGIQLGWTQVGRAEDPDEPQRGFLFNGQAVKEGEPMRLEGIAETKFAEALSAFKTGVEKAIGGDFKAAAEAFRASLKIEEHWHRARLFAAACDVLAGTRTAGVGAEAKTATEDYPQDWIGRRVGALVRAATGGEVGGELQALSEERESRAARYIDWL